MGGGSVRVDTVLGSVVRVRWGLLFPLAIAAWASRLGCYRVAYPRTHSLACLTFRVHYLNTLVMLISYVDRADLAPDEYPARI